MGDERAETYLRLLAETEARHAARRSGRWDDADLAQSVEQIRAAGDILVTAGVLEQEDVNRVATELEAVLLTRSDMGSPWPPNASWPAPGTAAGRARTSTWARWSRCSRGRAP